jgi:D-serine deaminase-like pyridoxal phosphate-dependent protein
VERLNEEHGFVKTKDAVPRLGEKLWVIPASGSKTIALHDEVAYGRRGNVDGLWRVAARGCVQ